MENKMNTDRFKFRVFDKRDNLMINENNYSQLGIYQLYIDVSGEILCIYEGYEDDDYKTISITKNKDRFVVERCTSMPDGNGNLIFEGDIVQVFGYEDKHCVCFGCGVFCWDSEIGESLSQIECNCVHIIGNVHENPELLK